MKKLLFMAALAGFALTSCTNDHEEDTVNKNEPQKITFASPVMYGHTRAVPGEITPTGKYPKNEKFKVFATEYANTSNFASLGWGATAENWNGDGETTHYDQNLNGWDMDLPKFWPSGKKMAFTAFSPADASNAGHEAATGIKATGFVVENLCADQYDFMWAKRVVDMELTSTPQSNANGNDDYNGVNLAFNHALSSIKFNVRALSDNMKLKSIKINNVYSTGDFTEGLANAKATTGTAAWSSHKASTSYTFFESEQTNGDVLTKVANPDGEFTSIKGFGFGAPTTKGTDGILLPQVLGETSTIVIEYHDGTLLKTATYNLNNPTVTAPITTEWVMGKRYIYNLSLSKDRIYFAPQVEDWTDETHNVNPGN